MRFWIRDRTYFRTECASESSSTIAFADAARTRARVTREIAPRPSWPTAAWITRRREPAEDTAGSTVSSFADVSDRRHSQRPTDPYAVSVDRDREQLGLPFGCEAANQRATLPHDRELGEGGGSSGVSIDAGTSEGPALRHLKPAVSTSRGLLYSTDCFNVFGALKTESIDCVFADPPFNLGKDYGHGSVRDALARLDYLKWSFAWIDECIRLLVPGGALFVYILPQWGFHFASHIEERGMTFRHWIALSMKGTFPRGRKLYPAHYALLYFTKGVPKTFNRVRLPIPVCRHCGRDIKDYGGHRKYLNPAGLNLTDFWDDTAPARHQKFKSRWHINELKPMIPARCIEVSTGEGGVVLDPFGGGGSTFEAAERLKRYWLGAEVATAGAVRQRFRRLYPDREPSVPSALARVFVDPDPEFRLSVH